MRICGTVLSIPLSITANCGF